MKLKKFVQENRRRNSLKRISAFVLAATIMISGAVPVSAAEVNAKNAIAAEEGTYSIVDESKSPKQLNVHVGNDAATEVNVTYTTVADTTAADKK